MYELVDKLKKNAQKHFVKNNSISSKESCKQGKQKQNYTFYFYMFYDLIKLFLNLFSTLIINKTK